MPESPSPSKTTLPSLTVIVPAYNEEDGIEPTVRAIQDALAGRFKDYEILIFDDGSSDSTGPKADALKSRFPNIEVIHNERNRGIGYNYRRGVQMARKEYCVMIPGDDETDHDTIQSIFSAVGRSDVVITYPGNPEVRSLGRRLLSRIYVLALNMLFQHRVRYFNGTNVYRSDLLRSIPLDTDGPAYSAAIVIRLLGRGATWEEVPMFIKPRASGPSKILKWKNVLSVAGAVAGLLREAYLEPRPRRRAPQPRQVTP